MTAEEWRPVDGFPDYQVSDLGRVLSTRPRRGYRGPTVLRQTLGPNGYRAVTLYSAPQVQSQRSVHSLVAQAFVGRRPEGMEVRHLDGDRMNNRASNLAYGTKSDNHYDQVAHGTHPFARKTHCPAGHPYAGENLMLGENGRHRRCRACTYASNNRGAKSRRAAARAA